jgi:electron transport complex protein RnfA
LKNLGLILISATLINNILLIEQIGICPILHMTAALRNALGIGLTLTMVMTLSAGVNWLIYHLVLVPFGFLFLKNLIFVLTIIMVSRIVYIAAKKTGVIQGILPASGEILLYANCLLMAATLLVIRNNYNFIEALVYALGCGLGFILVALIFTPVRERLDLAPISLSLRGMPIYLITLSLMALALLGGAGFLGLE